jgi:hypothetical protein
MVEEIIAVIRLSDGSLFVWSPVALSTALRAAVGALGPVCHLVSPNALHHLFLAEWTSAYPEARLYASPRLRRRRSFFRCRAWRCDLARGLAILTRPSCTEALR